MIPIDVVRAELLGGAFRPAEEVDADVPDDFGLYALGLGPGRELPAPFGVADGDRLVYIGKAQRQTLRRRLLGNELPGRGHGTFIRSLGAVLGFRPLAGSLAARARTANYRFAPDDLHAIVTWIDSHLEVGWVALHPDDVPAAEAALIRTCAPVLNLDGNPRPHPELRRLRAECLRIARG